MLTSKTYTTEGDLEAVGLSRTDAQAIYDAGLDIYSLKAYLVAGLTTVDDITLAFKNHIVPDNVRHFLHIAPESLTVTKMVELQAAGIYPRHLHGQFGISVNPDIDGYMADLDEAGISPDEMAEFKRYGVTNPQEIREYAEHGVTGVLLALFKSVKAELTPEELCAFGMLGLQPQAVTALYVAGYRSAAEAGAAYAALVANETAGIPQLRDLKFYRQEIVEKLGTLGERICRLHPGPRYTYQTLRRSKKLCIELEDASDETLGIVITLIEEHKESSAAKIRSLVASFK